MKKQIVSLFAFLAIAAASSAGHAAVFNVAPNGDNDCADFVCGLQPALTAAQNNGEDDVLNLAAGVYDANGVGFLYAAAANENRGLTVQGNSPDDTIIQNSSLAPVTLLNMSTLNVAQNPLQIPVNIEVRRLTFKDGNGINQGGGLIASHNRDSVLVERCIFKNNVTEGGFGGGLAVFSANGQVKIQNNIFFENQSSTVGGAAALIIDDAELRLLNNTFTQNATVNQGGGGAVFIQTEDDTGDVRVLNNIFFGNSANNGAGVGQDVMVENDSNGNNVGTPLLITHNDFTDLLTSINLLTCNPNNCQTNSTINDNLAVDPQFVDPDNPNLDNRDFHLLVASPVINAGTVPNPNTLPPTDFDGDDRVLDGAPDMGADEYVPVCGDAVTNGDEECDDDNNINTDACLNTCVAASCGDGFVRNGVEACDNGNDNSDVEPNACRTDCSDPACGDGVIDTGEGCDDDNNINTDACLNSCVAASCGDGFIQTGVEVCDDGNNVDTDTCPTTCQNAVCGDGFVQAGVEACDDANDVNTDACLDTCVAAGCGDGFVQAGVEPCDDGNNIDTDACLNTCVEAKCGDGIIREGFETCDDGNNIDGDACPATCGVGGLGGGGRSIGGCQLSGSGSVFSVFPCLFAVATLLVQRARRRS